MAPLTTALPALRLPALRGHRAASPLATRPPLCWSPRMLRTYRAMGELTARQAMAAMAKAVAA